MTSARWLPAALLICALCAHSAFGIRIYKSRRKAMAALSGVTVDTQQYFSGCMQSTNEAACELAIDNEFSQEWTQCAITEPENFPYWHGFLENPLYVTTVYILNADWDRVGDKDALHEFSITGNGDTCYTHESTEGFSSKTFPCDMLATEIVIRSMRLNSVLALCDIQVFGAELKFPTVQERAPIVTFEDCSHRSTQRSQYCWHAFDGYLSQKADTGACSMTNPGEYQYWKGMFKLPALVREVVLYNREDCCKEELTNFAIYVTTGLCARYNDPKTFGIESFRCNAFGDKVTIQQLSNHQLTLCEVKVFGHSVEMLPDQKRTILGCFLDKRDDPDLADFDKEPVSLTTMHADKCDRQCRRRKAKYFGLQEGSQCWCGNSFGRHGAINDTKECGMECEGKRKEYCGGVGRNIIYELKY